MCCGVSWVRCLFLSNKCPKSSCPRGTWENPSGRMWEWSVGLCNMPTTTTPAADSSFKELLTFHGKAKFFQTD
eukprot:6144653-Amphidinium_carterae.2